MDSNGFKRVRIAGILARYKIGVWVLVSGTDRVMEFSDVERNSGSLCGV